MAIQTQREQFGIFEGLQRTVPADTTAIPSPLTDHFRHNYLDENAHAAPHEPHGEHGRYERQVDDPEISGKPDWDLNWKNEPVYAAMKDMLSGRPIRSGQY